METGDLRNLSTVEYTLGKSKLNFCVRQSSSLFLHSELIGTSMHYFSFSHPWFDNFFAWSNRFLMTAVSCSYSLQCKIKSMLLPDGVRVGRHFYAGCQIRFFFSEVHSMTPRAVGQLLYVSSSNGA